MWQSALRTHRYRFSSIVYAFRISLFFFFNDTATTEIYTLSLHDALPICVLSAKDPLPPTSETEEMWDQCQHGTWYFLPWHRGYLAAFEAIVAKTVKELGGPADWALPYWNYLNSSNQAEIGRAHV